MILRYRKNDPDHNLLVAVQRWVHNRGGNLLVIGGVELQDWHEGASKFKVAVRCLGKRPAPPDPAQEGR
jgi:hypothetical protein